MRKATVDRITIDILPDEDPDTSYLEQEGMGFEDRLEQYREGKFSFVGIRAVAHLNFAWVEGGTLMQTIESGGLWGIEDDSGSDYFREVAKDEVGELKAMLQQLGFTPDELDAVEVELP